MNWYRQADKPLFEDVLWSRPENRRYAGKLLVIGGHQQSFNDVSAAYAAAGQAGAGTVRVVLPDKLAKTVGPLFPEAEYAPSNQIGSFSRQALADFFDLSQWADAVLLAGEFGKNSETAVLLGGFIARYDGKLAAAGDTLDYFFASPAALTDRPDTLIVGDIGQVQKLAAPALIQQSADLIKAVQQISDWAAQKRTAVITEHSGQTIAAYADEVSTTPVKQKADIPVLAAYAAVWLMQQPEKPFEALTTANWCLTQPNK